MSVLKAIIFLVVLSFMIVVVMVSIGGALISLSDNSDFNVMYALAILITFYLCTIVNRRNVKEAQNMGYASVRLPIWERFILFPMLQNLFTKKNVYFQRILLLNTMCILALMMTVLTTIFQVIAYLFHLIFNLTFSRKCFENK